MNTIILPPELLSIIIQHAAECDSTYDSYKKRLRTLSALSLVSRTLREIAQPLLAQKSYCPTLEEMVKFLRGDVAEKVKSLTSEHYSRRIASPFSARFENLTELRVRHLARLAFEDCQLMSGWSNLVLPGLVELSLDDVSIFSSTETSQEVLADFLSISHFPSLRVLGTRSSTMVGSMHDRALIDYSLSCQLDCIVSDQVYTIHRRLAEDHSLSFPTPFGYPGPFLFDLSHLRAFHASTSWGRTAGSSDPVLSKAHVRIRLPCKPTPNLSTIIAAFCLVDSLLAHSTALKELYLDFYPSGGRKGYALNEELQKTIRKLDDQAREKNVKIIWESHEDDWCRSLVSAEFWRRSKEKKKQEKSEED
ncbi:uncharacterized protein JCM6883_003750 [Sporobolomyces salmoneus]|uniref:uncharacterized protein n=1 Tax=Sporobolomyces salmoneus TaxID=183962 RepID=UPI00316C7A17